MNYARLSTIELVGQNGKYPQFTFMKLYLSYASYGVAITVGVWNFQIAPRNKPRLKAVRGRRYGHTDIDDKECKLFGLSQLNRS